MGYKESKTSPVTGTPSISLISITSLFTGGPSIKSLHKWSTCLLFNEIDGVSVTCSPAGSRTENIVSAYPQN